MLILFPAAADRIGRSPGPIQTRERLGGLLIFCHLVADMIYTAKIPVGWRGDRHHYLIGTHQGSTDRGFTQFYLDEFVFRFNRRSSKSRGLIFRRLLEQAAVHPPLEKRKLMGSAGLGP